MKSRQEIYLKYVKGKNKGKVIKALLDTEENKFYTLDDEIIDDKNVEIVDENGNEARYKLTPKGCLYAALISVHKYDVFDDKDIDNAFEYFERKMKQYGYVSEGNDINVQDDAPNPKDLFFDALNIFLKIDDKIADAVWEMFIDSMERAGYITD